MTERKLEIVGGGIAGLSLAIGLRSRGVPVVLREAGSYPRHRLCGEFVNGVSDETLQNLGVAGLFAGSQSHQGMTWWLKGQQIAKGQLESPVRALSRWQMDLRMSERLHELGGELECRQRLQCEPKEGRIWTAGRRLQKESDWLGLKAHFLGLETCSGLEMHLGEGGYLGLTPVENGRVNVCGLFRRREGLAGKGSEKLLSYLAASGLGDLAERLRSVDADEQSVTGVSGIQFGSQEQEPELLALGDAERMIPPFTGNGMSMAFEAAECALEPLLDYAGSNLAWEDARLEIQTRLKRRFSRRISLAKGMHRFILNSPEQALVARLGKQGWLPFDFLNRILT